MPLRILTALHDSSLYGAQRSLIEIIRSIPREQAEFFLALPSNGPAADAVRAMHVRHEIIDLPRWIPASGQAGRRYWLRYPIRASHARRQLARICEEFRPDIIYTNTVTVLEAARVARKLDIPHVWHLREAVRDNAQLQSLLPTWAVWRIVAALSARVIFNSKYLRDMYGARANASAIVIHNGIDPFHIPSRDLLMRPATAPPTILIAGFMDQHKGLDVLLDAARHLLKRGIDFRVLVAGQIDSRFHDREIANRLADPTLARRVDLLGWQADLGSLYQQAAVLVSCSRQEAFGRTILEAMAHGLPVVSSRSGGPEEIVVEGRTGFLFSPGDANGLAEVLARVLLDSRLAGRLGREGQLRVESEFNLLSCADKVLKQFELAANLQQRSRRSRL